MESERPDLDKLEELAKKAEAASWDGRNWMAAFGPAAVLQWIAYTRELEKDLEIAIKSADSWRDVLSTVKDIVRRHLKEHPFAKALADTIDNAVKDMRHD